jgi:hypothetical protein
MKFCHSKDYIRRIGREAMMDENIKAYGKDKQERSLYHVVMVSLPTVHMHFMRLTQQHLSSTGTLGTPATLVQER